MLGTYCHCQAEKSIISVESEEVIDMVDMLTVVYCCVHNLHLWFVQINLERVQDLLILLSFLYRYICTCCITDIFSGKRENASEVVT